MTQTTKRVAMTTTGNTRTLWIGNEPDPSDRLQIDVSADDYRKIPPRGREHVGAQATITDLRTNRRLVVTRAECGCDSPCALELVRWLDNATEHDAGLRDERETWVSHDFNDHHRKGEPCNRCDDANRQPDHNFVPQDDCNVRLCGICGYSKSQHLLPDADQQPEPGAGEGRDLTLPWKRSNDGNDIEDANGCGVFAAYADERIDDKVDYALAAVNAHAQLVAALERVQVWLIAPATDTATITEMRAMVREALRLTRDGE